MSLTSQLDDPRSPISEWMQQRFPYTTEVLRDYRTGAPALQIAGGTANPGTVGGALDWRVRFLLDPHPDLDLPMRAARRLGRVLRGAAEALVEHVDGRVSGPGATEPGTREPVDAHVAIPVRPEDDLLRACWALALLTEVYRAGWMPGSPLAGLPESAGVDDLLALAPTDALRDLAQLTDLARVMLLPRVRECGMPLYVGPDFAGSRYVHADADFVAGGTLFEVKAALGRKRPDGSRYCALDSVMLRQVLGYVMFDVDDRHAITAVALYAARYGYLVDWPLDRLLLQLAGREFDLAAERAHFHELLRASV